MVTGSLRKVSTYPMRRERRSASYTGAMGAAGARMDAGMSFGRPGGATMAAVLAPDPAVRLATAA